MEFFVFILLITQKIILVNTATTVSPWSSNCSLNCLICQLTSCLLCQTGFTYNSIQRKCLLKCTAPCVTCTTIQSDCLSCPSTMILQNSRCICSAGYFINNNSCSKCSDICSTCQTTLDNCITCKTALMILQTVSSSQKTCICPQGNLMVSSSCQICKQPCSNCLGELTYCTQCSNTNMQLLSGKCLCQNGYFQDGTFCSLCDPTCLTCSQTASNCQSCQSDRQLSVTNQCICNLGYFEISQQCQKCSINCLSCSSLTSCLSCGPGKFLQDSLCVCQNRQYMDLNQQCQQCLSNCSDCSDAQTCLRCDQSYFLDINNQCQQCHHSCLTCLSGNSCQVCSNQRIFDSLQQLCICQIGYFEFNKVCQKCKQECLSCSQSDKCIDCKQNREIKNDLCPCKIGYYEDQFQFCQQCIYPQALKHIECNFSNCNDGIWTSGEQCDDGNDVNYDGCSNCLIDPGYKCINQFLQPSVCFTCSKNCKICKFNQISICTQCYDGYFLKQNNCIQCDSNCQTCSKINYCVTCSIIDQKPDQNGKCLPCDIGYYVNSGICQSQCGDGIVASNEECDQGSQNRVGGCDENCKINQLYECEGDTCLQKRQQIIDVGFYNSTTENQILLKGNDTKIYEVQCKQINITIDEFQISDFNFTIEYSDLNQCILTLDYFKTINKNNIIKLKFPLYQQNRLLQTDIREIQIVPRKKIVFSENQIQQSVKLKSAQNSLTYLFYICIPLAILMGGLDFLLAILDILSWVNNLYYINIFFPINVEMILKNTIMDNFQLIPNPINLNNPNDTYYRESPKHFLEKGTDPLFINNTFQPFLRLILYFISWLIVSSILKILKKIYQSQINNQTKVQERKIQIQQNLKQIQNFKLVVNRQTNINDQQSKQLIILQFLIKKSEYFLINFYQYFIKFLNVSYLDILLGIVLHLYCFNLNQLNNHIVLVNYLLCFLSIPICIYLLYLYYMISQQHLIVFDHKRFKQKYGILYQGIKINEQEARQYGFISLIKKSLYVIAIVVFYEQPQIQTASCAFISSMNIGLIIYCKPFQTNKDLISIGVPDLCIFILMIIFTCLAIDDGVGVLNQNQRFQIGWVIIVVLCLSILIQFTFIIQEFLKTLKQKLQQIKEFLK